MNSLNFQLPEFEGPLDLLLHLIRKQKMDIFDINIDQITTQYLDYIQTLKDQNFHLASEFIVMSATLLQIKARMLMKMEEEDSESEDGADPRKELAQKLYEYQKFKIASSQMYDRDCLGRDSFLRPKYESLKVEWFHDPDSPEIVPVKNGNLTMAKLLVKIYKKAERAKFKYVVTKSLKSITQRIQEVILLLKVDTPKSFFGFWAFPKGKVENEGTRADIIVTLLAHLELAKQGFLNLTQSDVFGDIFVSLKKEVSLKDLNLDQVEEDYSSNANGPNLNI